ncbi:MAG: winged helix-turn-helix transcriptional regulator [Fibrobacter sp.]|nr:winged helix-turn-helix transcriptional regulator [Fibrobacter sp.]
MFETNNLQELTSRQKEILSLLRKGLTNNEICKTLNISPNTVKAHLANIYKILEVTNRTEAVSTKFEEAPYLDDLKKDVNIIFLKQNDISSYLKANGLYYSLVEAIHQYRIFRITDTISASVNPAFTIDVSAAKDNDESLFLSIRLGSTHEILWTSSIKITSDNISELAKKTAMLLFRNIVLSTAQIKYTSDSPIPYWWYVTAHCTIKFENRSKDSFNYCKDMLSPLATGKLYSEQALYTLSLVYYIAILDNWGDSKAYTTQLAEFARKAMFNAPYSIYSQMIMAFYNIVTGNKSEAIAYFKQVIEANPQTIIARTILIQIYMLTGQNDQALELIDECERLIPETAAQASIKHGKAFILLLQGKYEECINLANQILLYTPKATILRLFIIFCNNRLGKTSESKAEIKELYKEHPDFDKPYLEQILKGVCPQMKETFMSGLQNLFIEK